MVATAAATRIAVIGANFAGIAAARRLSSRHRVSLIDPRPAFEFLPNIHELVSGVKAPRHLQLDRQSLAEQAGCRLRRETVSRVHPDIGQLELEGGERLAYDACIVACGGVNTDFGIPGVRGNTLPFKNVDDCQRIGSRLAELTRRDKPARVVIIGGGFEGVECLGEILRRYRGVKSLSIHLVEAAGRLMPEAPACIDAAVRAHCDGLRVSFHFGVPVSRVSRTRVTLENGAVLRSDLTLWTAGAAPPSLLLQSGLAVDARSWAPVNDCLQSLMAANVFVAGDAADLPAPLSKQAYHALAMGDLAAQNASRWLRDRPLRRFRAPPEAKLIAFGDIDTFLQVGDRVFAGPGLAAAKETVFQLQMARQDSPLRAAGFIRGQRRQFSSLRHLGLPALMRPGAILRRGIRQLSS